MKRIITIICFLMLLPSVLAFETVQKCLNSTHLETTFIVEICDPTCATSTFGQVTNCTNGCSDNTCIQTFPKTAESYPWVIIGIIFIAVVFAYIGVMIRDEYGLLKALFISFSLAILLVAISIIKQFAVDSGLSENTKNLISISYGVMTWALYLFVIYFVLTLLIAILDAIGKLPSFFKRRR